MKELNNVEVQEVNGGFIGLFEGIFPMLPGIPRHIR